MSGCLGSFLSSHIVTPKRINVKTLNVKRFGRGILNRSGRCLLNQSGPSDWNRYYSDERSCFFGLAPKVYCRLRLTSRVPHWNSESW